jgi:hypothetical protein
MANTMKQLIPMMLSVLILAACASSEQQKMADAASTPLKDLNLMKPEIPDVLRQAEKGTFAAPADNSCTSILADIATLDTVLGNGDDEHDTGNDSEKDDPSLLERGKAEVSKAAIKSLQRTAEDVVPFRKWVRKLSGAERRSKDLADAIAAGYARRSFLKGYALAKDCTGDRPIVNSAT